MENIKTIKKQRAKKSTARIQRIKDVEELETEKRAKNELLNILRQINPSTSKSHIPETVENSIVYENLRDSYKELISLRLRKGSEIVSEIESLKEICNTINPSFKFLSKAKIDELKFDEIELEEDEFKSPSSENLVLPDDIPTRINIHILIQKICGAILKDDKICQRRDLNGCIFHSKQTTLEEDHLKMMNRIFEKSKVKKGDVRKRLEKRLKKKA
ncbi:hypothetical protein O9G_004410 [Rozella allomycis CSF55]|uniref:Uncharacterized protein n=1 Tax=Rozella allomycis (strain CSF55) TaxID=988480 RepID=A0A075ARU4_ROZAC|nr:hypothetical protein O9G_004410 [Rozella allomycis CSF55]|eukprot:EPZ32996.1 hypothetical protein O9G_004410 [Rozella allomycis CSF55]